ncbi:MAG: glycerate kinase [Gammaproteobacteria bacterium]|nr:glycerate kinase [Gammaproteobacteria bacterium]MBU1414920.1 glycerate kinase [Gammaproteobacteria bacterium]
MRDDLARDFLTDLFRAAIRAADPVICLPPHLPSPPASPAGRTVVVGAGKAAASMARALEAHWPGKLSGLVVTRYGHGVPTRHIEVVEAAHPVPDAAGLAAAKRIRDLVGGLTADDLVICLLSGGGSALLVEPLPPVTLDDKRELSHALLRSGASIGEINCVRRHLSAIKGGRLGAACHPARLVTLAISDVPGDNPLNIASGPTVADPTTCADALAILRRYAIALPSAVREVLESGAGESVKPGDVRLANSSTTLIATPRMALEAAATVARERGVTAHILGDAIEGEAREVGGEMAELALQLAARRQPHEPPAVLLSGGETTVTVHGNGRGGRNVEFLLALGLALDGTPGIHALAGDTDGVDGMEEIAGACLSPDSIARGKAFGRSMRAALDNNDGHGFFGALGDSIVTGPTLTNVNDFRAIYVGKID